MTANDVSYVFIFLDTVQKLLEMECTLRPQAVEAVLCTVYLTQHFQSMMGHWGFKWKLLEMRTPQ